MLYTIEEIREKVQPVAEKYHIKEMYLFGSYARGQADERSDIDLAFLKSAENQFSLLDLSTFRRDLENVLSLSVDLLTVEGIEHARKYMPNRLKMNFERDKVKLYEKIA